MNCGKILLEISSIIPDASIKQRKELNLQVSPLLSTNKSELDYTSDKITSMYICIHKFTP